MGFYFRKSVGFGPFRLNFSKSGLGVSAGVKGARISTGPKGTYVHAGRGGYYYRQKIDTDRTNSNVTESTLSNPAPSNWTSSAVEIPRGKIVDGIKPAPKQFLPTVTHVLYLAIALGSIIWISWYGLARLPHDQKGRDQTSLMIFTIPLFLWGVGAAIQYFIRRLTYVNDRHPLYYELDKDSVVRFEMVKQACEALSQSERISYLGSATNPSTAIYDSPVSISTKEPPLIATNVEVWGMSIRKWSMYFLPDSIFLFQKNKYSTLPYSSLRVSYGERRAFEAHGAPKDAQHIGNTWRHTRKDGYADLRYKNNPMTLIVLYGVINIEYPAGGSISFLTSSCEAARQFVENLKRSLATTTNTKSEGEPNYQKNHQNRKDKHSSSGQSKTKVRSRAAYGILGVKENAMMDEITDAYHVQARLNHPDKVANMAPEFRELAERRMKEINAAYQELKKGA